MSGESLRFHRRGNLNGTILIQMIVDALIEVQDAEIALAARLPVGAQRCCQVTPSPWNTWMDQDGMTSLHGTATLIEINGADIKVILEDIADNLYNP